MTHLSLFSGIGGIDLAAQWAGFRTVAFCEADPYCRKVLKRRWPNVPCWPDVRTMHGDGVALDETLTLLSGGFPCQDVSNAGTTHEGGLTGLEGERSGLWTQMDRIIGELEPKWVLVENVAALAVRGLDRVLYDLAARGYDAEWSVIRARDVGAPHIRKRLFVVAERRIRYASELPLCDCCDEPFCPECGEHYADCNHPGPDNWDEVVQDANGARLEGDVGSILADAGNWRYDPDTPRPDWRYTSPSLRGGTDGVPAWMDRLRVLGNAVVPQQVYPILKAIAARVEGE